MSWKPSPVELLRWHLEAGVDESIGETALDRLAAPPPPEAPRANARVVERPPQRPGPAPSLALENPDAAAADASALADAALSLAELREALAGFEACPLKWTATNLVFGDGAEDAPVMFIGEAPGAEEDRQGLPFVGVSGRLLDAMMASIGRDRSSAYITNILPWRPPGNRKPTPAETTMCLPFIRRHIALVGPRVLVFLGGTAAATLLNRREGITKLRGRWLDYRLDEAEIPAMPTYHPAFLLRQPGLKRDSWRDFLAVKMRLEEQA
ncbi:MAG: uracil-DNA glycosylase [Alphaproteobacteria bacterium]|jgi:DNA polymerase|nr:uracil-DNA glycosylase [Alphaproteobacteria bacterium]